jgi:hypothetical protein
MALEVVGLLEGRGQANMLPCLLLPMPPSCKKISPIRSLYTLIWFVFCIMNPYFFKIEGFTELKFKIKLELIITGVLDFVRHPLL